MPTYDLMVHAQVCFAVDVHNAQNLEDAEKVMTEFLEYFSEGGEGFIVGQRDCDAAAARVFGPDHAIQIEDARLWIEGAPGPIEVGYDDEEE